MYWTNLKLWAKGILWLWERRRTPAQLDTEWRLAMNAGGDDRGIRKYQWETYIVYQPKWGPWTFLPVYLLDVGTRVLTGGSCVTWSRWWYENRRTYGSANLFTRLLNKIDKDHGRESGTPLWGTKDCGWAGAGGLAFWSLVLGGVLYLAYGYWQGG